MRTSGVWRAMTTLRATRSRLAIGPRHLLGLVAIALIAAGCSLFPGSGVGGTLVVVETRGGHCINPPCGSRVAIDADGRVHQLAPIVAELGTVPPDVVAALTAAVRAADFQAIKSKPFAGECPVNFDGQEVIYEFWLASGIETIASCTVDVDPEDPLFRAVEATLNSTSVPE